MVGSAHTFAQALTWDSAIVDGTLDNGFQYLLYPSPNQSEPFNLRLIVNAGSVDDNRRGMAHVVEHMVFRGNRAHPVDVHRLLDQLGWRTGVQINAMTRQSETQYMLRTRPNDALDLGQSVQLLSDLAFGAKMKAREWQIERSVILEEMRSGNSLAERVNDQKKAVVRNGSRYVDRPTIGRRDEVEKITIEEIRAFYDTFYVPGNMTLVASGHIDPATFEKAVQASFGREKKAPVPVRDYIKLPLKKGLYIGKVQDPKGVSSLVAYGFRSELAPKGTELGEYQRLQNYFLRKLVRPVVEAAEEQYSARIDSLHLQFSEPTNERLVLALAARTDDHDQGLVALLRELERLRKYGFQAEDFAAQQQQALKTLTNNQVARKHRNYSQWEDRLVSAVMQDGVEEDGAQRAQRTRQWIEQMTVTVLNQRLAELLSAPDQFLYYQLPGGVERELPSAAQVSVINDTVRAESIQPLALTKPTDVKESAAPPRDQHQAKVETAANVATKVDISLPVLAPLAADQFSHKYHKQANVHEWQLANGDRVVWLKRATPSGELYLKSLSAAGYHNNLQAPWLAQTAGQIWRQADYLLAEQQPLSQQQLTAWQKQNGAEWLWAQKPTELDLSAKVTGDKLPLLMQIYTTLHNNWQLETSALTQVKASLNEALQAVTPQSQQRQQLWGWSPQSQPTTAEIDNLTLADLQQAIRQQQQQPVELFIVGDALSEQIEGEVLPYLAAIKRQSADGQTAMKAHSPQLPAGQWQLTQEMHDDNRATVTIKGESPMPWRPEASFLISTINPIAQKVLKNRLRHDLGGLYSLQFEMQLDRDNVVRTSTSFTTAPEKVAALVDAHRQVLDDLGKQLAKENYPRIQADIRFAEQLRLSDPNTWLRRLALSYARYQGPDYLSTMSGLAEQVNPERLTALAEQIFPQPKQAVLIGTPII